MISGSLLTIILPLYVLFLVVPVCVASQYGRAGRPRSEFNYPVLHPRFRLPRMGTVPSTLTCVPGVRQRSTETFS